MSCVAIDCRLSAESKNSLENLGFNLIEIPENERFSEPISSHPDIFICKHKKQMFADSNLRNLFAGKENLIYCDREVPDFNIIEYPYDVCFNVAFVGDKLICNEKYTSTLILDFAKENGIKIVNVAQGYCKCSTAIVDDNSIITEDDSIYNAAINNGIDVLKIQKGHVKLDGYDYGFIGGCSGLLKNDLLAFNGKIEKHPDYSAIKEFCSDRNVDVVSLAEHDLYDVGSFIVL